MQPIATSNRIRRALLHKTGQTTSYVAGDDGALQIGESHKYTILTTGQYSGTFNIVINGKTDVHSNACVLDESTGLMWSRTIPASVGATSNGFLPWTTNGSGEGIFPYAVAAAGLAGYSDWKIPNYKQLLDISEQSGVDALPNAAAWPSLSIFSGLALASSSTSAENTAYFIYVQYYHPIATADLKTIPYPVLLVRGPG